MATPNDLKTHEKTYGGFTNLLKWVVPLMVAITLVVILLIS